ncbi:hypothetical protein HMPREF1144_2951 [Klebsiella sp. OBRC7]|nr:hypothetical protein HMPREF1144_2951 [Klebsiella sp. OBRC7]
MVVLVCFYYRTTESADEGKKGTKRGCFLNKIRKIVTARIQMKRAQTGGYLLADSAS